MCLSAILWTGISAVVYGTSISTLLKLGWRQIDLSSHQLHQHAWPNNDLVIQGGILEDECDELFSAVRQEAES